MSNELNSIDIQEIFTLLPHRYPFLLIDRVVDYKNLDYLHGYKNITVNEPIFTGHFPEKPVLPGVCLTHIVTELLSKGLENQYRLEEGKQLKFLSLVTPDVTTSLQYVITYKEIDEKVTLSADVKAGETVCFKIKATYSLL